jgi:hypothetical protein
VVSNEKDPGSRWQRLRGHGAFQAAVLFASAAWLGLQAADVFALPTTVVRVVGAALLGIFGVLASYAWLDTRATGSTVATVGKARSRAPIVLAAAVGLVALGAIASGW